MLLRIVTGGQTGVDQAALRAARAAGFEAGGFASLGWATEGGPAPWLADFGLVECESPGYPARRLANVKAAEVMILIGRKDSPGSKGLLRDWAKDGDRPWKWIEPGVSTPRSTARFLAGVLQARTLMVAGNRESSAPGIGERAERFLTRAFLILKEIQP